MPIILSTGIKINAMTFLQYQKRLFIPVIIKIGINFIYIIKKNIFY